VPLVLPLLRIGEAQLLAYQGQREVAVAVVNLIKRAFVGAAAFITRGSPG
jgi:hypothetical protein